MASGFPQIENNVHLSYKSVQMPMDSAGDFLYTIGVRKTGLCEGLRVGGTLRLIGETPGPGEGRAFLFSGIICTKTSEFSQNSEV